jgi:exodeoxyribonuclease VII small subunit
MTTPTEQASFENLYSRLQTIVAQLEAGELSLADSLTLYEEGVSVAAACQSYLDTAELRIQELQSGSAVSRRELWED